MKAVVETFLRRPRWHEVEVEVEIEIGLGRQYIVLGLGRICKIDWALSPVSST